MAPTVQAHPAAQQAKEAASAAAKRAGVTVVEEADREKLRDIESLLISIWGMSSHGAPVPYDILRSISHAGCNISAAYTPNGTLCGTALAIVTPGDAACYSLIAGVTPGMADKGVGFALKQHQRVWSLNRGIETMTWTFDPLASRNARYNLSKLGAYAREYVRNFYGEMDDDINANDESDRLVAVWPLAAAETIARSEGFPLNLDLPAPEASSVLKYGPDRGAVLIESAGTLWCRVPHDIVALRASEPEQAALWRSSIREALESAFASGYMATGVTRTGWYQLTRPGQH